MRKAKAAPAPVRAPVEGEQRWARTAAGQRIKVTVLRVDAQFDRVVVEDHLWHQRTTIATGQLLND